MLNEETLMDDLVYDIGQDVIHLVQRKNHDYGNSFEELVKKYGAVALLIRFHDKINRLDNLLTKEGVELKVVTESAEDTLKDLAGYALLGLALMKKNKIVKDQINGKQELY